jgi:hypothetical protein
LGCLEFELSRLRWVGERCGRWDTLGHSNHGGGGWGNNEGRQGRWGNGGVLWGGTLQCHDVACSVLHCTTVLLWHAVMCCTHAFVCIICPCIEEIRM